MRHLSLRPPSLRFETLRLGNLRRWTTALLALALLLVAAPLAAYTVYLKDGSKIIIKEKYRVQGGTAILTLPNGSQSSIPLNSIDIPKTDQANTADYGTALVIEGGEARALKPGERSTVPQQKRLADLITERGVATRELPTARRPVGAEEALAAANPSGWPDLMNLDRKSHPDRELAAQLEALFYRAGLPGTHVYEGTTGSRAFVELPAATEPEVLRALEVGADLLLKAQQSFPGRVGSFELLMVSPAKERGGQFLLTPEQAAAIVGKKVDLVAFFLSNVQY
jgi:hypothetical protein